MLKPCTDILIIYPGHLEASTKRGGGREARLMYVAKELSKNLSITIVAPFFGRYCRIIRMQPRLNIRCLHFPASRNYPSNSNFTKFMQLLSLVLYTSEAAAMIIQLRRRGLKIVLISDFVSGVIPAIVAKVLNLKVLCYEGNIIPWAERGLTPSIISLPQALLGAFTRVLARIICRLSDAIVVNDGLIRNGMIKLGIREDKIFVIRGAVDTAKFKPPQIELSNKEEFVVGFIGRLTKEKGALFLLNLCKAALDKLPEVRFIILGDGQFKESLKALPNVKHVGQVAHNEVCTRLSPARVIVTFQESFGMGEVEALSCGKPVIASKIGEMPKLIGDDEIGLLCEPNIDSYIKAIRALSENDILLKKLSEQSRIHAVTNYDWKIIGRKWASVVNYLLKS